MNCTLHGRLNNRNTQRYLKMHFIQTKIPDIFLSFWFLVLISLFSIIIDVCTWLENFSFWLITSYGKQKLKCSTKMNQIITKKHISVAMTLDLHHSRSRTKEIQHPSRVRDPKSNKRIYLKSLRQ